ncbi:MAG TPA: 30S ribosomal protein S7 [Candidatus Paceibacterota bacterium]|nr:30S ribosomal protein S7 [Candidatus Paceibacterota bacterium]
MRRPVKNRNMPEPDLVYGSVKVSKLINYVMERGKKDTARKIVYKVFDELKKDGDPVALFEQALENAAPSVEVRSRRVGGANYQVPREVRPERRLALGLRWIVEAAEGTKGVPMDKALLKEIQAAIKNEGAAVAKKETTHRMAEANKAFAHFAW